MPPVAKTDGRLVSLQFACSNTGGSLSNLKNIQPLLHLLKVGLVLFIGSVPRLFQ